MTRAEAREEAQQWANDIQEPVAVLRLWGDICTAREMKRVAPADLVVEIMEPKNLSP